MSEPKSFSVICHEVVCRLGVVTIRQLCGIVGKHISTSAAAHVGRNRIKNQLRYQQTHPKYRRNYHKTINADLLIRIGRYQIVAKTLQHLKTAGKVELIGKATYKATLRLIGTKAS